MRGARGAGQPTFETNERRAHGADRVVDGRAPRALDRDEEKRRIQSDGSFREACPAPDVRDNV